ncbi:hypothetical protein KHS38_13465 [Mucilaginibacter sp. Bleaf8]|uniref:DUF6090 family protein n=1 Tax=Mucilaginibacter sp. Bleaf8 TaxID=2834430 RepID=UPI001BCF1289|nr:DUF6090 family protein [Mucilaginibacter sp. Bleaf8]MBS7565414.1 hypothetical protein [Mucilaginibacter sp. Bleaf8]
MEHEIMGHTRKIYRIVKNTNQSLPHKLKEIFVEIAIIVFAVLLAAYIEGRSEHAHEQHEVHTFLTGLRADLENDVKEMESDRRRYRYYERGFKYFSNPVNGHFNPDSIKKYWNATMSTTGLVPNNGRYEGFKSSGKITNIEDTALQNNILDLYQENIPALISSTNSYGKMSERLQNFILEHMIGSNHHEQVLLMPQAQNLCASLSQASFVIQRYDEAIENSKKIIEQIEKAE